MAHKISSLQPLILATRRCAAGNAEYFSVSLEPALREQVAKALLYKGITSGELGQSDAEPVAYEEVIRSFADSPEPALRELVAKARASVKRTP